MSASAAISTRRERVLAHGAMLLYAALVAGSFSFGALAAPHIDASALTAARFVLAAALMGTVLVAVTRRRPRMPTALWRFAVLGSLMGAFFVTMFVALRITDPVSTSAVFTLIPLMSAVFGYVLLRQITRPVVAVSLVIAATGALWVIFRGDVQRALAFEVGRGESIFLFGCACQAAYGPLVRLLNRGEAVLEFTFWTLVIATLCVAVFSVQQIVGTDWRALPTVVWYGLAYLTVFATAVSFFLLQFASLRLPAAKVFSYGYLIPGFVIILELALGHGGTNFSVAFGALITVLALVVLVLSPDE